MSTVVSGYGSDLEFICVCLNFPLFFESVDMVDGSLSGMGAITWVECVGDNLGDVGVCNLVCAGCWRGKGDVAGEEIEE